jgi:hypothetical protein
MIIKAFKLHLHALLVVVEGYPSIGWYAKGIEACITSKMQKLPKR